MQQSFDPLPGKKERTKGKKPRDWCIPKSAFGSLSKNIESWNPPSGDENTPENWARFRAAVIHHVIAVFVRAAKNQHEPRPLDQRDLGKLDERFTDDERGRIKWNQRLNGHQELRMPDVAVLMALLPGGLPSEADIEPVMDAAVKGNPPPHWWGKDQRATYRR